MKHLAYICWGPRPVSYKVLENPDYNITCVMMRTCKTLQCKTLLRMEPGFWLVAAMMMICCILSAYNAVHKLYQL